MLLVNWKVKGENKMFKNWRTTLFGIGGGVLNMFANGTNWKQILMSVAITGIGLLAKDHNVTGGTVTQ